MKTLVLFSLSLTVALGTPILPPGVELHPDVRGEDQNPLLGDLLPVQGHVVVENPAPPLSLSSKDPQEKTVPVEIEAKLEVKREPEVKLEPDVKMEDGVKAEQEAEPEPLEAKVKIEPEREKELQTEVDFKVESEVKVDPEELREVDRETNPDKVIEEWHIDMEGRHGPVIEPLDDDDMLKENHKEMPEDEMREDYVPGEKEEEEEDKVEEEELLGKSNSILDTMESESEMMKETFQNHVVSEETAMDEETSLDLMEQQMNPLSEARFSDEETLVEMFPRQEPEQAAVEDEGPHMDVEKQEALRREYENRKEGYYCTGTFNDGICYQFFQEPKKYEDAELFCQNQFPGGHLASITSQYIHRDLMSLILKQNGAYTRTWVGGRRLDRNRFIWLDGSPWSYEDWLPGEPNDTAGVEDCVEVLHFGNGKFNDFTCWEPQAFICSYPYDACSGRSTANCLSA